MSKDILEKIDQQLGEGKEYGVLEQIAKKILWVDTLKTRNSDSLDFYNTAVWQIKEALLAAYKAGKDSK